MIRLRVVINCDAEGCTKQLDGYIDVRQYELFHDAQLVPFMMHPSDLTDAAEKWRAHNTGNIFCDEHSQIKEPPP